MHTDKTIQIINNIASIMHNCIVLLMVHALLVEIPIQIPL